MTRKLTQIVLCFFLLMGAPAMAQTMSDAEVLEYLKQGNQQGKDQQQMAVELARRGVTEEQARRVKEMYQKQMGTQGNNTSAGSQSRMRQKQVEQSSPYYKNGYYRNSNGRNQNMNQAMEAGQLKMTSIDKINNPYAAQYDLNTQEAKVASILGDSINYVESYYNPEDEVFGRNIFNTQSLTFEPNINLATPANYQLGPGDEVIIDIWGASQNTIREQISPDGTINIQDLGVVNLNGMTIAQAGDFLKRELSKIYSDSQNSIQVTLGNARSISINVMGEVLVPGTYQLSSFSTVFHALYSAGGVSEIGSLRNIQVVRNGENIATVDVYDFIMKGKV